MNDRININNEDVKITGALDDNKQLNGPVNIISPDYKIKAGFINGKLDGPLEIDSVGTINFKDGLLHGKAIFDNGIDMDFDKGKRKT